MWTTSPRPSPWASAGRSERARGARLAGALAVLSALGACGRPAGVIFDPAAGTARWPPPPDEPRLRYVGQLASDRDLKPARSFFQTLGDALLGEEPARTMLSPLAVCTDGKDRVFVADSNAQAVHVFDLSTRRYGTWRPGDGARRPGVAGDERAAAFSQPVALAWDPAGRLLVSDSVAGVVFVFGRDGRVQGTIGRNRLLRPCGLAVDAEGQRLFVADAAAHQVVVFSPDDQELGRLGRRGVGPGEFNYPTNVALDRRGRLYVSDSLNFRVQAFGPTLEPVLRFGSKGDMPGYFAQPKGIAVDGEGRLYVVDAHFEAVQVFDDAGRLLMTFGREGHGPGEFWLPAGIHVDATGRIWIADSYNRRVQVFDLLPEGVPRSTGAADGRADQGAEDRR